MSIPKNYRDHRDNAAQRNDCDLMRRLWCQVVLYAIDDAIIDNRKYGDGDARIAKWANSKDGRLAMSLAGIDYSQRVVESMRQRVLRGITSPRDASLQVRSRE